MCTREQRLAKIKEIIENHNIETQEDLTQALENVGIKVTQATVSRDIKSLKLYKVPDKHGVYYYAFPKNHALNITDDRMERIFKDYILDIRHNNSMIVLRTMPGTAQSVGFALDYMSWRQVLGTIAGDDTVFICMQDEKSIEEVVERLQDLKLGR